MNGTRLFILMLAAAAGTLPGLFTRLFHVELSAPAMAITTGGAILSASFLLLWACEAAQKDVSRSLALAVVALIAVLPEYAVDMYFTWQAGQFPESDYAHYAIANMTGANRLLIGVAWAVVTAIAWFVSRKAIVLEAERRTEILFLGLGTLYAFLIPIKGNLAWYDGLVLLGIFAWYVRLAARRPATEFHAEGPAALLADLPVRRRRTATVALFLFSAGVILACAEPFSESLVASGKVLGIDEFLLVQWLAPIASEAPEFVVAILFALRGQAAVALGSLLSSKLNQWTLLVGMIPGVYAASSGSLAPLPLGPFQLHEILLTAAQSLLAVGLLSGLRLDTRGALLLFGLFAIQFTPAPLLRPVLDVLPGSLAADTEGVHLLCTGVTLTAAFWVLLARRRDVFRLRFGWNGSGHEPARPVGLTPPPCVRLAAAPCPSAGSARGSAGGGNLPR